MQRVHCLAAALSIALLAAACGNKKSEPPSPPAPSAPSADTAVHEGPEGPEGPFAIVLESKAPVVFSALEGGVIIAGAGHLGRAVPGAEISSVPMPEGLPEGRVLRAAGRMPWHVWLLFETLKADGKVDQNPLFRLEKPGWKKYADDWRPAIAAWTKNRVLAASTSSGKLKIKLIEPSLPEPPADLPSPHLGDASCEATLKLAALAALPSGEVIAAGNCKPDTGAGAGASPMRYVILRWTPAAPAASDAGAADAGAADAGASDHPGVVEVIPGVSVNLAHEALHARAPGDVWIAARDGTAKPAGASSLFHHDGATWSAVALPPSVTSVRALAGAADGSLWLAGDRAVFHRSAAGTWEQVPLPHRGFKDPTWDILDVAIDAHGDVWVAARRTAQGVSRDVVMRSRATSDIVRWE